MPLPPLLPPDRVDYLPIVDRPVIRRPNGARVAFWVAPNVEHYEYLPPLDGVRNPWPRSPAPDVATGSEIIESYARQRGMR